ncbi:MAG: YihY/virulence factor BrkB family protein [Nakamurella sp.]
MTTPASEPPKVLQPDAPSVARTEGYTSVGARREHRHTKKVSAFSARETLPWPYPGGGEIAVVSNGPQHRVRKVIARTLSKAWRDSLFRLSAEGAFWSALSTAPLLLALLGLVGFVGHWFGPHTLDEIQSQVLTLMHGLFSSEVVDGLLVENVSAMLHNGQADLVSVGFFISLWAGSSAISSLVESITIAYGQYEVRHPAAERLFALGLYLVALIAGTLTLPLLAVGPESLINLFPAGIRSEASAIITVSYYPAMVLALVLLLTALYKVAPRHKHPWRRGIPGALLATAVFVVASSGLRIYVSYVYTHGLAYGALATPVTFLLFYYMMTLAIVLGAQFNNATLEYFPARVSRREQRKWRVFDSPGSETPDSASPDAIAGVKPLGDHVDAEGNDPSPDDPQSRPAGIER